MDNKAKDMIEQIQKISIEIIKGEFGVDEFLTKEFKREMIHEAIYLISVLNSCDIDEDDNDFDLEDE